MMFRNNYERERENIIRKTGIIFSVNFSWNKKEGFFYFMSNIVRVLFVLLNFQRRNPYCESTIVKNSET